MFVTIEKRDVLSSRRPYGLKDFVAPFKAPYNLIIISPVKLIRTPFLNTPVSDFFPAKI